MGAEDAEKHHNNTSPDERLRWDNEEMLEDYSPLAPRRGKKRARSSSPVSSPALDKARTSAANVKRFKQALTSQRADPALDLWDRFGVGVPDSATLGATNPVLAHLMVSSSPRPSKENTHSRGETGLRRAMSCGSHWPKRRRGEPATKPNPTRERTESSKFSMVTALLETVNSEISRSDEMEEADLDPESPSIRERRSPTKPAASPTAAPGQDLPEAEVNAVPSTDPNLAQAVKGASSPSTDYGDDDFDEDTILELDASVRLSGQVEAGSFTTAERILATGTVMDHVQKEKTILEDEFEDEFDDLDDDTLLAAVEDVFRPAPPTQTSRAAPTKNHNVVHLDGGTNDSEDTYEDDFGEDFGEDFDFEAVELAATQSLKQKASSLMPVCTT